ncbi:MAG: hypothetical protein HQ516_03920 [Chlorobium sp.]|nr:hypothetical protein [Chlorobium sp.]
MCVATVVLGVVLLSGGVPEEESSFSASLSYAELISYGLINGYSTNVLVHKGFAAGSLTEADALDDVDRNMAFAKVLQRYANSLKRASAKEDKGMRTLIANMCEVATYVERQTGTLKDWINNPESKSAKALYDAYCDKVEKKVELMLAR